MTAPIPVAAYVNIRRSLGEFTTVLAGVRYLLLVGAWIVRLTP